jgi:hypothetical protein
MATYRRVLATNKNITVALQYASIYEYSEFLEFVNVAMLTVFRFAEHWRFFFYKFEFLKFEH